MLYSKPPAPAVHLPTPCGVRAALAVLFLLRFVPACHVISSILCNRIGAPHGLKQQWLCFRAASYNERRHNGGGRMKVSPRAACCAGLFVADW